PSMRTTRVINPTSAPTLMAVAWAKATHSQLDQELGMLRVTVARLPTEEGTTTLVSTVAPLRSNAAIALPAILEKVTASGASCGALTAFGAILAVPTAPSAILAVPTAPSAILELVTAPSLILAQVTAWSAILAVVTAWLGMPATHAKPS